MPYRDWANLGIQLKADYELFNSVSGNMVLMQGRIFGGGGGGPPKSGSLTQQGSLSQQPGFSLSLLIME